MKPLLFALAALAFTACNQDLHEGAASSPSAAKFNRQVFESTRDTDDDADTTANGRARRAARRAARRDSMK